MGQISSTLLMDIHLGTLTSQTWWQMVHGVITWFSMVLQTALKHAFTWSAVCRITMTWWSAQSMMLLVATGLCWVTCMSFTMLVFFHMKDAKMSNYSVMFNIPTRVNQIHAIWIKQLHLLFAPLLCWWQETSLSIYAQRVLLVRSLQFFNVIVAE